ncbi:serine/threonine protein kinase [Bacillus sp. AFS076308]|uniref:serine/threonine protein kinase n=1 Tax=unclassified Bacillus (in: firmicutes) TaxID=185979 RepID=UPI000BF740F5|nr:MULTISPECIES: serine/threonine protein kinase [unclassified Bacillus (in: firmicutes)]PFO05838.1 serine/threonine protein kinase [Bacillus sp. AFS076308]PGV54135.1 serine/threonine protein kinase [Bacillus sp. AFS037270]
MKINEYVKLIETELLPYVNLSVLSPFDPIIVENRSHSWRTIGCGNYAGVFLHESYPEVVVKVYGRNHEELVKEIEVYKKLGNHESFSRLYAYGENYLILKKLEGITLFNAVIKGVQIPKVVIEDIDLGLEYARTIGLNPFDVHGKNVVMFEGRGYIVDVSDFYKQGYCRKWDDLKKAYYKIYRPFLFKYHPPIPFPVVDGIRKGYRMYRKVKRKLEK